MRTFFHFGIVLLALILIALPGCRRPASPEEETAPEAKPSAVLGPSFAVQVEPAVLQIPQGGKGKLKVSVVCRDYQGPIALELRNLPDDVTASKVTLAAGQRTGEIELTASKTATGSERADTSILATTAPGKQATSRDLRVSVAGPPFALETGLAQVKVPQGSKVKLKVTAARKGYEGPIAVELLNVPKQVTVAKATIPGGQDSLELEIAAATRAPTIDKADVQVLGTASAPGATYRAVSPRFMLSVQSPPFALQVEPTTLRLTQGGKAQLTINAVRKGYQGPIAVEFRNLPAGVTAPKVALAPRRGSEEVELSASFQAAAGPRTDVQVVGSASADIAYEASAPAFTLNIQPALTLQVEPRAVQVAQGGKVPLKITSVRTNYVGPITVEFRGLPGGVTAPKVAMPSYKHSEEVELTAAADASLKAGSRVQLVALAPEMDNQQLAVVDLKLAVLEAGSIPTGPFGLKVQPSVLQVTPGNKATLKVIALRKEYKGPITLELRNLPPHVTAASATIPAKQNTAEIEVTATADAVLGDKADVNVLGTANPELQIASPNFTVSVQSRPFELRVLPGSLRITSGSTAALKVQATRKSYQGPIDVELRNLPAGLSAARAVLPAGQNEVAIEVSAEEKAAPATKYDVHVLGTGTDRQEVTSSNVTVNVVPGLFELKVEPALVQISHGAAAKVKVSASRKGYQGPITVELRNLPIYVTAPKATIAQGEDAAEVEVKADFKAIEGDSVDVYALATVGVPGKQVLSPRVTVSIISFGQPPPFELKVEPKALTVQPGAAAKLKVRVLRKGGFDGPVTLEVCNLPADVSAAKVAVPMGQAQAELELSAQTSAVAATRSDVCVLGTAAEVRGQSYAHASPHVPLTVVKK